MPEPPIQRARGIAYRTLGSPALFAITYASLAGGLYLLLGPIAGAALGATPLVMVVAAVLFGLAVMTYVEGAALHPERGGSPTFARHGLDELWSFVAAWALLLDAVLLTAAATLAATNYLEVVWAQAAQGVVELTLAGLILLFVGVRAIRGGSGGPGKLARLSTVVGIDLVLQAVVVALGLILLSDPGSLTRGLHIGTTPSVQSVLYALGAAMVVVTGLESVVGMAGEVRIGREGLKRVVVALPTVMLVLFTGVAVVGLMALPAHDGATPLGTTYVNRPIVGIIAQIPGGWPVRTLEVLIGLAASATLIGMALASLSSAGRITAQMALHRQLPTRIGRLHREYGTPWIVIVLTVVVAAGLVALRDMDALVGMMAFGALLALTIAHVSVIRLRFREPDLPRPYRIPLNVRVRGTLVPIPAVVGALLSALVWVSVVAFHPEARAVGLSWTALGLIAYVVYRRSRALPVRARVAVPERALKSEDLHPEYVSILVPVLGSALDDDLVQTAGRLAGGEDETDTEADAAVIEAVWVHVLPMSLPIDGPLPEGRLEEARAALARAAAVGDEYEGVRVATSVVRARSLGRAIVDEAHRRGCQAIVMVAPPPTGRARSGRAGALLGASGGRGEALGDAARYVVEHADCQVLLTAPSLAETETVMRRRREAQAGPDEDGGLTDEDERWLEQL